MNTNTVNAQVGMLIKFTAQPGKGADLAVLLVANTATVAAEPGTLLWQVDRQANNPDIVFLYERYDSPESLDAHNDTDLNAKTRAAMGPLLGGAPEVFPLIPAGGVR